MAHLNLFLIALSISTTFCNLKSNYENEVRDILTRKIECDLGFPHDECPLDGGWSCWSKWSDCEGVCGHSGVRRRTRTCTDPEPKHVGSDCVGRHFQSKLCKLKGCTVEEYKTLIECDEFRMREFKILEQAHISYPALIPRCLEAECHFEIVENLLGDKADRYWSALHCVKHNNGCPRMGEWSSWSDWSECSSLCGKGKQIRCRTCSNPPAVEELYFCKGENCTYQDCSASSCDMAKYGNWGQWSSWTKCSESCGNGLRSRERECVHGYKATQNPYKLKEVSHYIRYPDKTTPNPNECQKAAVVKRELGAVSELKNMCLGPRKEILPCFLDNCPIDGSWSEWEPWSQCSTDCKMGTQSRSRACSNPPPAFGGEFCDGPVSWIRNCFEKPCTRKYSDSVSFAGDGALAYYKTGHSSKLFHMFIKFKSTSSFGELVVRDDLIRVQPADSNKVELSIKAKHIVLFARISSCSLLITTFQQIKLGEWSTVLVMITPGGATLRLNDDRFRHYKRFSCPPIKPEFDLEMVVGRQFKGEISRLVINFVPRSFNVLECTAQNSTEDINMYPYSNNNVMYDEGVDEENVVNLNDLILAPCAENDLSWTIEMVIKTACTEGAVLLLKDYYVSKYLLLIIEPYRVVLQLEDGTCFVEVYQSIDKHEGNWMVIYISYESAGVIGLQVNGRTIKKMSLCSADSILRCEDNIFMGNIEELLKIESERSRTMKFIEHMKGMQGVLAFLKIDDKEIDLSTIPIIRKEHKIYFSSETSSYSGTYEEVNIKEGENINLTCMYYFDETSEDIYSTLFWNRTSPKWLRLDTVINNETQMLWKSNYSIHDNQHITTLATSEYDKDDVEGFYSCWLPNNLKHRSNKMLVTYGLTILDCTREFKQTHSTILYVLSICFLAILIVSLISLAYQYFQRFNHEFGAAASANMTKRLNKHFKYILMHSPEIQEQFGVKNKLNSEIEEMRLNKLKRDIK